jgi:mannosyltransferase
MDSINKSITAAPIRSRWMDIVEHTSFQYAALTLITLIALLMRFYRLGDWGFWIDEVITVNNVMHNLHQSTRPTYHLIGIAVSTLGVSDWSARLVPALVGIISLPLLYFPTRKLFGVGVALLAVFLLAISPWHLYWSQNARFYTLLMLLYSLGTFAFFHWLETDRFRYLGAALVLLGLAALERMNTVFFGPVVVVYLLGLMWLPFGKPPGLRWRNLVMLIIPVLLFAGYQIVVSGMFDKLTTWIFGRTHNPLRVLLSIVYDIGLPLFLLALLGGVYLMLQKNRAGLFFFLGAVVPTLTLVALAPFTQAFSRYVFMTLPLWVILAAAAAKELYIHLEKPARILAVGLVFLLAADAVSQDVLYFTTQNGNRERFKEAFAYVDQHRQPEDWVVSTRAEIGDYYLDIQTVDSNQIDLDGILASERPAWFVMDNRTHISDRLQGWISEEAELLQAFDVYIPGRLMEMRVYRYAPQ